MCSRSCSIGTCSKTQGNSWKFIKESRSTSNLFAHISVQYIHFFSILLAISVFYNELYIIVYVLSLSNFSIFSKFYAYLYSNFRINQYAEVTTSMGSGNMRMLSCPPRKFWKILASKDHAVFLGEQTILPQNRAYGQ